jgi:ankyrin repeat protein
MAVQQGNTMAVLMLARVHGIDTNVRDPVRGTTALMEATVDGKASIAHLLLGAAQGLDVNARGPHGYTALLNAVSFCRDIQLVRRLLLQPGIDTNATTACGWTPLICATVHNWSRERPAVVKLLLELCPGLDVNAQDETHADTALMYAAMHGNKEVVRLLLSHPGIDPAVVNSGGHSAFYYARRFKRLGCMEAIAEHALQLARRKRLLRAWLFAARGAPAVRVIEARWLEHAYAPGGCGFKRVQTRFEQAVVPTSCA